jgi:hypothetical protein
VDDALCAYPLAWPGGGKRSGADDRQLVHFFPHRQQSATAVEAKPTPTNLAKWGATYHLPKEGPAS